MAEPAKPFACSMPDCGMSFTNEDHLHVHTKKHDMVLQLGLEQKAAFVADQTPTPTRFIRNCEEVGLFQDLQNVAANPFDEGFKRAMEAKNTILSLESAMGNTDDVLHTPQMVFPLLDNAESTLFTNNQRNITISRSSSDESGTIKEFETRTISKLTNEVITISRVVNNIQNENASKQTNGQELQEVGSKNEISVIRTNADGLRSVLFPENVVKEAVNKANHVNKDIIADNSKLYVDKVPIMSQKSIDFVVDSLTSELTTNANQIVDDKNKKETKIDKCEAIKVMTHVAKKDTNVAKGYLRPKIMPKETRSAPKIELNEFEVIIKMPDGKRVKMKPVEEEIDTKSHLRNAIVNKAAIKIANLNQVLVNQAGKVPIQPLKNKPVATQAVKNIFHVTNQHVKNKLPVTSQPVKSKPVTSQIVKNNSPVTSQVATPVNNIVNLTAGTLIPVTLVNQQGTPLSNEDLTKVRITKIGNNITTLTKLPANGVKKVKSFLKVNAEPVKTVTVPLPPSVDTIKVSQPYQVDKETGKRKLPTPGKNIVTLEDVDERLKEHDVAGDVDTDCVISDVSKNPIIVKRTRLELESRCAASKRYRERLKEAMMKKTEENRLLFEANQRLIAEKAVLKLIITEHMKGCPNASDIVDRLNTLTNGQSL